MTQPRGEVPSSPLHRQILDSADSHRHIIAHRSITLVPHTDPNSFEAYSDSVLWWVPEGNAAPITTRIFAEDIYIYAGSTFNFPGKTVSIFANRVIAIQKTGVSSEEIVFDLNGGDGAQASDAAKDGDNGVNGEYELHTIGGDMPRDDPEKTRKIFTGDGKPGVDGTVAGTQGGSGGHFCITARLCSLSNIPIRLVVKASGGKGGKGQAGGRGGNGGNGALPKAMYSPDGYIRGGNGGKGGKGANGASGGDGGSVLDFSSAYATMPPGKGYDDVELKNDLSFPTTGSTIGGGVKGDRGAGGQGGTKGQKGYYFIWQPFGPDTKKEGPEGHDGDSNNDTDGSNTPVDGKEGNQLHAVQQISTAVLACLIDPIQLILVMNRLLFEYQLLFTAQSAQIEGKGSKTLQDVGNQTDKLLVTRRAMFQESWEWIGRMVAAINVTENPSSDDILGKAGLDTSQQVLLHKHCAMEGWSIQSSAREQLILIVQKLVNLVSSSAPHDMYNVPLETITRPNLALTDVQKRVTDFVNLEQRKVAIEAVVMAEKIDREKVKGEIGALQSDMKRFTTDRQEIVDKLSTQYTTVSAARAKAKLSSGETKAALEKFWSHLKSDLSCAELTEVMSAVGNVFMFAHPGASAVFKLGGLLSAGAAASKLGSSVKTAEGHVEKDALHGKFYTLQADLSDAELKGEITKKNAEIKSLSGADQEYVNAIVAERDSFRKLCNQYFSAPTLSADEAKELKAAKQVFDEYVEDCQAVHTAVLNYNTLALELANFELEHHQKQTTLDTLQNTSISSDAIYGSLVYSFYRIVYTNEKAKILRLLFEAVRSLNGIFLARSTLFDDLWHLAAFDNIKANEFEAACKTRLADDVERFRSKWFNFQTSDVTDRMVVINKDTHRRQIQNFKDHRKCVIYLPADDAVYQQGWSQQWFDVRLLKLHVYLMGAINKFAKANIANTQVVDVNVEMSKRFVVLDENFNELTFEVPDNSQLSFAYNYSKGPEAYFPKSDPKEHNVLGMFSWAVHMEDRKSLEFSEPMRSPFVKYTISVDDSIVTKDVEEIHMSFDLRVRSSNVVRKPRS